MPLNPLKEAFFALNLQALEVLKVAHVLNMWFIQDLVFLVKFKKGTDKAMVCTCVCVCVCVCVLVGLVCMVVLCFDVI